MRIAAKRLLEWSLTEHSGSDRLMIDDRCRGRGVVTLGAGDPIVLVPGLAGGAGLLTPLAYALASRHRVSIVGLNGDVGFLGVDPAQDVAAHADDLAATIDGLGLERPIVMGVSFGGAIALEYAVTHPNRLGGLAVWGAEATFRPTLGTEIARRAMERFPLPPNHRFLNQFFNLLHGGKPEPGPLADFVVEQCWTTDQCVVARRIERLESFDVADRLWRIDAPTLILAGRRDVVVPPSRQRALARGISSASFVEVEGAGHVGFLTHRDEVCGHLARLAAEVRLPR